MGIQGFIQRIASAFFAFALVLSLVVVAPQAASADELKSDEVRIHVMNFPGNDAIIIECDGHFGIVDSGEDSSYPDGSDPRYPVRPGTVGAEGGHEEEMVAYLHKIGVTQDNLDFYIATHSHSDHIGSAPYIIREFHPKRIYLAEYDDSLVTNSAFLWDNQYVYDRALEAALWARENYGAILIQHLDPNYVDPSTPGEGEGEGGEKPPVTPTPGEGEDKDPDNPDDGDKDDNKDEGGDKTDPSDGDEGDKKPEGSDNSGESGDKDTNGEDSNSNNGNSDNGESAGGDDSAKKAAAEKNTNTLSAQQSKDAAGQPEDARKGSPTFMLGSAKIEILNYDETYLKTGVPDLNHISYGVKVTAANGRTAFLSGDINNYTGGDNKDMGDEDRLKNIVGPIDLLKLGHHGYEGSNSDAYLNTVVKQAKGEDRCVLVSTGSYRILPQRVYQVIANKGARVYSAPEWSQQGKDAFVAVLAADGVKVNTENNNKITLQELNDSPYAVLLQNAMPVKGTGWYTADSGKQYYFGVAGSNNGSAYALIDCWATLNGSKVYIDSRGEITHYDNNDNSNSETKVPINPSSNVRGWQKYGDDWVYYDTNGKLKKGWLQLGSTWYYLRSSGIMATGFEQVDGKWYFMSSSGAMQTGWVKSDGKWFFFNGSGVMQTGWVYSGGAWYYLAKSGAMQTGWQKLDNIWYFLKPSGAMQTGWLLDGGVWYFFNGSGAMKTGWVYTGGAWYYMEDSGAMLTGWQEIGKTWYFLTSSGAMKTGWVQSGSNWYFMDGSGAMAKGWRNSGGTWYYMHPETGLMQTGSLTLGDKSYYLKSSGAMATGWVQVSGKWYYHDGSGAMQKNKWIGNYYVGSDGVMATNQWIGKYHVNANGLWDATK